MCLITLAAGYCTVTCSAMLLEECGPGWMSHEVANSNFAMLYIHCICQSRARRSQLICGANSLHKQLCILPWSKTRRSTKLAVTQFRCILPAPPHDATGHTWHHDNELLFEYTKLGGKGALAARAITDFNSGMPAFDGVISDEDIWDILAFIKSTWPEREQDAQASRNLPH